MKQIKNNNLKTLAIIPARGGSKRLPGKNLLNLGDIPLLMHSINYARANSDLIDRIIVSTDDKKIKKVAMDAGVEVIDRPSDLSSDTASSVSVLKHVIEILDENFENIILMQPTNPLRPEGLLKNAIQKFRSGKYESLMTVSRSTSKLGKITNNKFVPFNYRMGQRSQDLEPLFYENGLLYVTKASLIVKSQILGENNFALVVDHPFARVDIDTGEDFEYAEFILRKYL